MSFNTEIEQYDCLEKRFKTDRLRESSSRGLWLLTRSTNRESRLALIMACRVEILGGETGMFRNGLRVDQIRFVNVDETVQ